MNEISFRMYHNDEKRLFYNTGNKSNSAKRCGAACMENEDIENYPKSSLYQRFKYLKKKSNQPPKELQKVTKVNERLKVNRKVLEQSTFFNDSAQIDELETGMIHCRGLISPELLGKFY